MIRFGKHLAVALPVVGDAPGQLPLAITHESPAVPVREAGDELEVVAREDESFRAESEFGVVDTESIREILEVFQGHAGTCRLSGILPMAGYLSNAVAPTLGSQVTPPRIADRVRRNERYPRQRGRL